MLRKKVRLETLGQWQEYCRVCGQRFDDSDQSDRQKALDESLHRIGSLEWSAEDRKRARKLAADLSTRITAAPLRYRDGNEAAALKSLYDVFVATREEMLEGGADASAFSALAVLLLEYTLRPFTGYWHGRQERGAFELQDARREFRQELAALREELILFRNAVEAVADGSRLSLPKEIHDNRPSADLGRVWPDGYLGPVPTMGAPSLDAELRAVAARRQRAYGSDDDVPVTGLGPQTDSTKPQEAAGLVGLALSGGGIRSATFCLGVVQRLAKYGVLRDVDYLSTVSGGGYLGSFLSTRLHRWAEAKKRGTVKTSYEEALDEILIRPEGRTGDSASVRWLRNQSKFLLSRDWRERAKTALRIVAGVIPLVPSLHSLYRDRLARCYIEGDPRTGETRAPRLSELVNTGAPYHLVNTSLNLPGSKNPELRGRRSDFFVLSPLHTGSVLTGYRATSEYEKHLKKDLASAMAISGAAVSSHMGTRHYGSIVRFFLTMLNVRLGVWLPNPSRPGAATRRLFGRAIERWREVWARFDETQAMVNLSDGGHVENLGLYELLRRQCKFIVVVDGECDPDHTSGALIKAARLARIDMGVKIDIDVSDLRRGEDGYSQTHFAFGTIDYTPDAPWGQKQVGYLLYLKLSMTGNEPDYVQEYRRQNPAFPHQTTLDQLFDEEQFEAYRALGEHVADDLFRSDVLRDLADPDRDLRAETYRTRTWLKGLVGEFLERPRPSRSTEE